MFLEALMKKILRIIGVILLVFVIIVAGVIGFLTIDEYKPEDVETLEISGNPGEKIATGKDITMMTWNIGYGALGDNADFFMDGGKMVYSSDKARVISNLENIGDVIDSEAPEILFLQEADRDSSRSYHIDELEYLKNEITGTVSFYQSTFAYNFKVFYVPLPVPPIGKVEAGLVYMSQYETDYAERVQLPCPFSWPLRTFNLKRCLEVVRLPVDDSDKELVMINLHLEAYDEGDGKIAQTNMLKEIMLEEIEKGNYVIVAGDFNQTFSNVDLSNYPVMDGMWEAGIIDVKDFGDQVSFLTDATYPTCRSLDRVLADTDDKDPTSFQYYMLDGYIISSNVEAKEVTTLNTEFEFTDHNPVILKFELMP